MSCFESDFSTLLRFGHVPTTIDLEIISTYVLIPTGQTAGLRRPL